MIQGYHCLMSRSAPQQNLPPCNQRSSHLLDQDFSRQRHRRHRPAQTRAYPMTTIPFAWQTPPQKTQHCLKLHIP